MHVLHCHIRQINEAAYQRSSLHAGQYISNAKRSQIHEKVCKKRGFEHVLYVGDQIIGGFIAK